MAIENTSDVALGAMHSTCHCKLLRSKPTALFLAGICGIITLCFSPQIARGDSNVQFLTLSNSPRHLALGGISTTIVGANSAMHNPGAHGVYALHHRIAVLPNSTSQRFLSDPEAISLMTRGLSLSTSLNDSTTFSVGLAISQQRHALGVLPLQIGSGGFMTRPTEVATTATLATGFRFHDYEGGIGVTLKRITSSPNHRSLQARLSNEVATGVDVGALVMTPSVWLPDDSRTRLGASLAYSLRNIGSKISTLGLGVARSLPTSSALGISFRFKIRGQEGELLGLGLLSEAELFHDSGPSMIYKIGFEMTAIQATSIRLGYNIDKISIENRFSWGLGVRPLRLLNSLAGTADSREKGTPLKTIFGEIDLIVDYARVKRTRLDDLEVLQFYVEVY